MSLASKENVQSLMLLFKGRLIYLRDTLLSELRGVPVSMDDEELKLRFAKLDLMEDEIIEIIDSLRVIDALKAER